MLLFVATVILSSVGLSPLRISVGHAGSIGWSEGLSTLTLGNSPQVSGNMGGIFYPHITGEVGEQGRCILVVQVVRLKVYLDEC